MREKSRGWQLVDTEIFEVKASHSMGAGDDPPPGPRTDSSLTCPRLGDTFGGPAGLVPWYVPLVPECLALYTVHFLGRYTDYMPILS